MSFEPEYPGDTPNRAWVRKKCEEKGIGIDCGCVIPGTPRSRICRLFRAMAKKEQDPGTP